MEAPQPPIDSEQRYKQEVKKYAGYVQDSMENGEYDDVYHTMSHVIGDRYLNSHRDGMAITLKYFQNEPDEHHVEPGMSVTRATQLLAHAALEADILEVLRGKGYVD